jgi:2-iminoacetate synthase ThiH
MMASSFSVSGVSPAEAYRLIRASGSDLTALLREASRIRDARTGHVITYSRKVFIPLTNLCRDRCGYCTFAREPDDSLAHTMTPEEVLTGARAARKGGCKEALFSLGDKPKLRYPAYRDWLEQRGLRSTVEYLAGHVPPALRGEGPFAACESGCFVSRGDARTAAC